MTLLDKVKIMLGITSTDKDGLLLLLIEQATEEAVQYTHNESVETLSAVIVRMVVYNYNRLGTEGVDSEGYSGVSFNYSADYPEAIMRTLRAKRKVQVIKEEEPNDNA